MTDGAGSTTRSEVGLFALAPGLSIGRYTITAVLGQGGFGITYRARDSQLDRDVAIKEYLPSSLAVRQNGVTVLPRSTEVAQDFTWGRDRFVAEGRTLASLTEASAIVRVFDFLESNGTAYIVMELVPGETLEQRLRRQRALSAQEIDSILPPLLDGLEQVHETGFLHRDIKPANILLRPTGRPVLIDFGASRAAMAGRSTAMTAIFTPGFAAAEQMTSAKQGPWTDIYALAATMYAAIAGNAPPPAFDRMLEDTFRPLSELRPNGFSYSLLTAIDAGLAVRAGERPQSIAAWRRQLYGGSAASDATVAMRAGAPEATAILSSPPSQGSPPSLGTPASQGIPSQGTPATPSQGTPSFGAQSLGTPSQGVPSQTAAATRRPMALYAGLAALALLVLGGGGYYALQDKPKIQTVALQDMKVEDLEKALEARRKADAEAIEKRRLEDEAKTKAQADAEAKQKADADLDRIRQERQKAEQDLERLKAELQKADAQRQAQIEEEQRKAETAAAEKRRLEEEAQKKADADARAKAEADANLARAQAEREKADADARAKQEAETRQKAEADGKTRAEAEAREKAAAEKARQEAEAKAKADAEDKKLAEAAETGLKLSQTDRQRLQIALTSQGFDTRGSDGAFGPRTREMIAGWQKARSLPATGFLNAAQQQQLQREASAALQKYDDEKKANGSYGGSLTISRSSTPSSPPMAMLLQVADNVARGEATMRSCGSLPIALTISDGQLSGTALLPDPLQGCRASPFAASGKLSGETLELNFNAPGARVFGSLRKGFVPPLPTDVPSTPDAPQAAPQAAGANDGTYGATFALPNSAPGSVIARVAGASASGEITTAGCGNYPFSLSIAPSGQLSGTIDARIGGSGCIQRAYAVSGRFVDGTLQLDLRAPQGNGSVTLRKGFVPPPTGVPSTPDAPKPDFPQASAPSGFDGTYGGSVSISRTSNMSGIFPGFSVRIAGTTATGTMFTRGCGAPTFPLSVAADGRLSGNAALPDGTPGCSTVPFAVTGKVAGDTLEISLSAPGQRGSGTLRRGVAPSQPGGGPAPAPADAGGAPVYRGSLGLQAYGAGQSMAFNAELRLQGNRLVGQIVERRCGNYAVDLPVSAAGDISGDLKFIEDPQCSSVLSTVTGKVTPDAITLEIRNVRARVSGTLKATR